MSKFPNGKFESNKKYFTIAVYTIIVVLIASIIIRSIFMWDKTWDTIHWVFNVLFPFLLGAFLALILAPLVKAFEESFFAKICKIKSKKANRILSILICYLLLFGLIGFAINVVIPQVWKSIIELTNLIPQWYTTILTWIMDTENAFPGIDFEFVNQEITKFGETLLSSEQIQKMASNILPVLLTTSISLVGAIVDFFIALIVSLYILIDMDGLMHNIHHLLRAFFEEKICQKILEVSKDCADIFNRYVTGKMIDSLVIGVLCFFLMNILRLPYSIIISLVVGITNMIPYFGPYVGCIPGALILLMISPVKTLIYLVMILVLQQFDGLILGPKILGDSTGLRPFWIIFAVSVGGSVGGVLGMFLGVPVVAIIGYLVSKWIDYRIAKNALKEKQEILEMYEEMQTEDTATSPSEE